MIKFISRFKALTKDEESCIDSVSLKDRSLLKLIPKHVVESDCVCQVVVNGEDFDDGQLESYQVVDGDEISVRVVPKAPVGAGIAFVLTEVLVPVFIGFVVGQIISAIQGRPEEDRQLGAESPTYDFDQAKLTTANGTPIACLYGKMRIHGHVLSAVVDRELGGRSRLTILIGLGEGGEEGWKSIGGFTSDTDSHSDFTANESIFIEENAINNFQDVTVSLRLGTAHQAPISTLHNETLLLSTPQSTTVGESQVLDSSGVFLSPYPFNKPYVNISPDFPFVYTTSFNAEIVRITFQYEYNLFISLLVLPRSPQAIVTPQGIGTHTHKIRIEYKEVNEDWANATSEIITTAANTRSVDEVVFDIDNPNALNLNIRIRDESQRLHEVAGSPSYITSPPQIVNEFSVAAPAYLVSVTKIEEITRGALSYPGRAVVAIEALATENLTSSNFDSSFICEGAKVRVYSTSDVYSVEYSNNPSWGIFFLLTNFEVGLGKFVSTDETDIDSWISFADFCDELVSDGAGGLEKRFEMNVYIDSSKPAWEWITNLAKVFQCAITYSSGKYSIKTIRQQSPVMAFGPSNSKSLAPGYLEKSNRINYVEVSFLDEDDLYRESFVVGLDKDIKNEDSFIRGSERVVGVTKRTVAQRLADQKIRQDKLLFRIMSLEANASALRCEPYDVVEVADTAVQWGSASGAVVSSSASAITIDEKVLLESGSTYSVRVFLSDGTFQERVISNLAGEYLALTLATPFETLPSAGDAYTVGTSTNLKRDFLITSIVHSESGFFSVNGLEYNDAVFTDEVDEVAALSPKPGFGTSELPSDVTDLVVLESSEPRQDGTVGISLNIFFTPPIEARFSHAKIWVGTVVDSTVSTDITWPRFPNAEAQGGHIVLSGNFAFGITYHVAATSSSIAGVSKRPEQVSSVAVTVVGKIGVPGDITNFAVSRHEDLLTFTWDEVIDSDLYSYQVRQGSTWSAAIPIAIDVFTNSYQTNLFFADPTGAVSQTFLVKAQDRSGNLSTNAASVVFSVDPRRFSSSVVARDEANEAGSFTDSDDFGWDRVSESSNPVIEQPSTVNSGWIVHDPSNF